VWFDPPAVTSATDTDRWYPGERMVRLRAGRSYGFVLALVFASFLYAAAGPESDWSLTVLLVLQTATLAVAVWTSGLGRRRTVYALVLALVGIVLAGVQGVDGSDPIAGVAGLVSMAFVLLTCVVVAMGVFDQRSVNTQSVVGAICIYVLLGMIFTYVYGAVAALGDGDFFVQGTDGTLSLRLYFSYVTLATLGYGDYTPAGDLGHTLAVVEALLGQLYLVTVVAVLVSRFGHVKHEPGA
jgi:voltage-gated potassium channel